MAGFDFNELVIIIAGLGFFSLSAYFVLVPNNAQKLVHGRARKIMAKYSHQANFKAQVAAASLKKKQKDLLISNSFGGLPTLHKLREKLDRTGKDISLLQYLLASLGLLIAFTALFEFALGFSLLLALLLGVFAALMVPHIMVGRWEGKRMKKFMLIMPDAIDLIIRGLRSGLPVTESINTIRDEIAEPVRSIFADISQSVRIGVPFEEALLRAAKKLQLNEFNFFVISVSLQRETGGNLAEILENLSTTIRARAMMKLKIKAITSEARMSAYIVGALPFLVMLALSFLQPGYLAPLVDDMRGNIAAGAAGLSFFLGMFIMIKMAKFQI